MEKSTITGTEHDDRCELCKGGPEALADLAHDLHMIAHSLILVKRDHTHTYIYKRIDE